MKPVGKNKNIFYYFIHGSMQCQNIKLSNKIGLISINFSLGHQLTKSQHGVLLLIIKLRLVPLVLIT